jgi:hypothetical protein
MTIRYLNKSKNSGNILPKRDFRRYGMIGNALNTWLAM